MHIDDFLKLVERLTGTPVKDVQEAEQAFLHDILSDDTRSIDCSQFNELLLIVNKDRVNLPFFAHFFGAPTTVGQIAAGVERFQQTAMRRYGNFIFGYRTLSRIKTDEELKRELGDLCWDEKIEMEKYARREPKLLEIGRIAREDTQLVGYLSPAGIIADDERIRFLQRALTTPKVKPDPSWEDLETTVRTLAKPGEHRSLLTIAESFRKQDKTGSIHDFAAYLGDVKLLMDQNVTKLTETRQRAGRNLDVYLTWDHMDVYFATSMRKAWEYEDLFDFINNLMKSPELDELNLRYFDPTQSYTENRINKGLIESLMLKRAKCTVYSVQDTDTLGKDSELAATLAQGKPVIAYVPDKPQEQRVVELLREDPVTVLERLRFVLHADEQFGRDLAHDEYNFVRDFYDRLDRFALESVWLSILDEAAMNELRKQGANEMERLCRVIAWSEKRIYDKRARTLVQSHPLAIQVNLHTGVANGVLVVRNIPDCAKLLRRILTNAMEFDLEEGKEMWYLRERITGCVYRVVTKNRKLSNCFWNFYLR